MERKYYEQGMAAFIAGKSQSKNPCGRAGEPNFDAWRKGWMFGRDVEFFNKLKGK